MFNATAKRRGAYIPAGFEAQLLSHKTLWSHGQ